MSWHKLTDLTVSTETRILTVRPRRRTYIRQSEAGYDWAAGREFVVTTKSSPYCGQVVAVDERHNLKREGYTRIHIAYNHDVPPLEVVL